MEDVLFIGKCLLGAIILFIICIPISVIIVKIIIRIFDK